MTARVPRWSGSGGWSPGVVLAGTLPAVGAANVMAAVETREPPAAVV